MPDKGAEATPPPGWIACHRYTFCSLLRGVHQRKRYPCGSHVESQLYHGLIGPADPHDGTAFCTSCGRNHCVEVFGANCSVLLIDYDGVCTCLRQGLCDDC